MSARPPRNSTARTGAAKALCFVVLLFAAPGALVAQTHSAPSIPLNGLDWYIARGFDANVFELSPDAFWPGETAASLTFDQVVQFPVQIFRMYPELRQNCTQCFETFTLVTYFDAPEALRKGRPQPGILFAEIGEAFEVYVNGKLIAKEGIVRDGDVRFHRTVRSVVYEIDANELRARDNQLVLKLMGDPRYQHFGLYVDRGYEIGFYAELRTKVRDNIALFLLSLYLFAGLYHLLLASVRRKERYNLYFGVFCLVFFVYRCTRTPIIFELPLDSLFIRRLELTVLYTFGPLLTAFFDDYFVGRVSRLIKGYAIFCALLIIPNLVLPIHHAEWPFIRMWQASILLLAFPYIFYHLARATIKRLRGARRLLAGTILLFITAAFDIADAAYMNTGIALTKYGLFLFVLGIALILADRFLRLHIEVEDLNRTLEKRVEDRTGQLNRALGDLRQTYDELRQLKEKQDADYYLTSLLLRPLSLNQADADRVRVEFHVRQKKVFRFRRWESEIGGDLCISNSIVLRGRRYTAFINADAMGKSIQGAGGALVLGVVYNSMISRTISSFANQNRFPEQWLKANFIELQDIFQSFDGLMSVTALMGLVDEENGFTYYLNAEHPRSVLYRDERASFLHHSRRYLKIGSPAFEGPLIVDTFAMKPGDVILHGSDGRDDLYIGENADGTLEVVSTEEDFLLRVEEGRGILREIDEAIRRCGEMVDDISLLRISFLEDAPAVPEENLPPQYEEHRDAGRRAFAAGDFTATRRHYEQALEYFDGDARDALEFARACEKLEDYERIGDCIEDCTGRFPGEDELILIGARAYKHLGRYETAADYGERIRLRNPRHVENLLNLADVYRHLEHYPSFERIVDELLDIDPDNAGAVELIRAVFGEYPIPPERRSH